MNSITQIVIVVVVKLKCCPKLNRYGDWIETRYSEVFWTAQPNVDLPSEVKAQFKDKPISITGFEVDVLNEYNESVPEFLVYVFTPPFSYPFSNLSLPQVQSSLLCDFTVRFFSDGQDRFATTGLTSQRRQRSISSTSFRNSSARVGTQRDSGTRR